MITRRSFVHLTGGFLLPCLSGVSSAIPVGGARSPELLPGDERFWKTVRQEFLLSPDSVFFNTGTVGAMPRVVRNAVVQQVDRLASNVADWNYQPDDMTWISGYDPMNNLRTRIGNFINADAKEVALTENVTSAISYLANGLALNAGDEVIMSDQEHVGGANCWLLQRQRKGIKVTVVELPKPANDPEEIVERLLKSFSPRTRVLLLSHIITGSGAIMPVREICHAATARGIVTVIDGAQAIGQVPVDVREMGCDAYAGCFHKWMGGPAGSGLLYVRDGLFRAVEATVASTEWNNHDDNGYRISQRGTGNYAIVQGIDSALDFYGKLGPATIYARIRYLGDYLRNGLRTIRGVQFFSPNNPQMCAGMTVFRIGKMTGPEMQEAYWAKAKLRPRSAGELFGLRQCTHIYNSPEEIDRSIDVARSLA